MPLRVTNPLTGERAVARSYIAEIIRDMRSLNLRRAEVYPRVSGNVPEIIDLVECLLDRGYAYEANGSVYFDVTAFESYGALSNQDLDETESQGGDERAEKRHPADVALWKAGGVEPDEIDDHQHVNASATVADDALREAVTESREAVETAMNDDFNTREALAAVLVVGGFDAKRNPW